MSNAYHPKTDEALGPYLKRLRTMAGVSMGQAAKLSAGRPQSFTTAWLGKVEKGGYEQVGGERLRTLAAIYSDQLGTTIPAEWLLALAGYEVQEPVPPGEDDELLQLFKNNDARALVAAVGKLIELGHPEDVRFLLISAQRFISARSPHLDLEDIYSDPLLSDHVKKFLKEMGL